MSLFQQIVTTSPGTRAPAAGLMIDANFNLAAGIIGSQQLACSTYAGIDATGSTDSFAGLQAAVNAAVGMTLVVDCPIYIQAGLNYAKTVFFPTGSNLFFTPNGKFIVDGIGAPPFAFYDAHDCTWINWNVEYIAGTAPSTTGSFGATAMGYGATGNVFGIAVANSNNTTMTNYLANLYTTTGGVQGVNFTGGAKAVSANPANMSAIFQIRGNCYRLNFLNGRLYVPDGVTADCFIPMVASIGPSWNAGSTVSTSTSINSTTCAFPQKITFDGLFLDGYVMGIQGSPQNITVKNVQAFRFSDFQDASGGTNNVGGVCPSNTTYNYWFPPPHLLYMDTYGSPTPVGPAFSAYIENVIDWGVYVGTPTRRWTGSGFVNSLKVEASSGTVIKGYTSLRPDGGMDSLSSGYANGDIDGLVIQMDTSITKNATLTLASAPSGTAGLMQNVWNFPTATLSCTIGGSGQVVNGTFTNMSASITFASTLTGTPTTLLTMVSQQAPAFAIRFPSSPAITNLQVKADVTDVATTPYGFPIDSTSQGNVGLRMDLRVTVPDFPVGATYVPGFWIAGSDININCEVNFLACTSTSGSTGLFFNQYNYALSNSKYTGVLNGWRTLTYSNYGSYVNRMRPNTNGALGNYFDLIDTSNNWHGVVEDGILTQHWTQSGQFTPTAGATYTTTLQWNSQFSLDRFGYLVTAAIGGPTTISFGTAASPTLLISAAGVTTNSYSNYPLPAPITYNGTALLLTANGSNFTGTGTIQVGARGVSIGMAF